MNFSQAFEMVRQHPFSVAMRLPRWSSEVQIRVQIPDAKSKMTHPYLFVHSRHGNVPWIPTQVEMFSEEWQALEFHEAPPFEKKDS